MPIPLGLSFQSSTDLREINVRLKEVQPLGFISERLKYIVNRYSIRTVFKTRQNLTDCLMRTKPIRTPQETANCVLHSLRMAETMLKIQADREL